MKAIFVLNKYLHRFTSISVRHKLELFDKLILPILSYGCEVWGFHTANSIERVHLQFCKRLLGVKNVLKMTLFMENLDECHCSYIDITALLNFGLKYCIVKKQNILELYIILCITI